jgi:integrase
VLTYWQAVEAARKRRDENGAEKAAKPLTVADAMAAYLAGLAPKAAADARYRSNAFILPALGEREVASLTVDDIRSWHRGIAANGARLRSAKGKAARYRQAPDTDDAHRRRQATANRVLTVLKAALNHAWRDGKVPSDTAWRQAKPFKDVERSRDRYLTVAEAQRLINAADADFRLLVQAALMTGARYGELGRLTMADFNQDTGSLAIRRSKSGKPRHVELTEEGVAFFRQTDTRPRWH